MKATQHSPHPTLSVVDPRALAIRSVAYCQHPDKPEVEPRITRQIFDEVGREVAAWDPRLWGAAPKPNLSTVYALSGQALLTDSVDAGWQLSLLEQAGSTLSSWDARGTQRHYEYDTQRRSVSVTEQMVSHPAKIVERLIYGDADEALAQHNQCGRLIRHDHPAGSRKCPSYGIAGSILTVQERFLEALDAPDWPVDLAGRDALLEEPTFTTRSEFNSAGQLLKQIDARDNAQRFGYDIAGRSREVWLQMAGEATTLRSLVSDIRYNAQDQVEFETAGNGVIARADYDARDGRLTRLTAAIHPQKPSLDLHYCVDPVGNIVELEDKSQPITYFKNQRIVPACYYRYDSLYQLVEAKGWEVSQPSHGPALPELIATPLDPAQRRNYLQKFVYDSGGNLVSRQHSATAGFAMFTSGNSNRSLGQRDDGSLPGEPEINAGFDKCGNQIELNRGQKLVWDTHNQLHEVAVVSRENQQDDFECYRYDRVGHRVRKVSVACAAGRALRSEVRYLPGLELRRHNSGEERHVINVIAGRNSVRMLHWPDGTHADQVRYGLSDHLSSSTLELDDEGAILTLEHYYAFGGTACWAAKNASVARYKTHRYSGKERDATGLYYYGYRYYAPWLQRWISSDPFKDIDGLNIYCAMKNNPVTLFDVEGGAVLTGLFYLYDGTPRHNKMVVDYELPDLSPGAKLKYYLAQSQPGNAFGGIINIKTGVVNIYPLSRVRPGIMPDSWRTDYQGTTHDKKPAIVQPPPHLGIVTSHELTTKKFSGRKEDQVGFTFQDVRGVDEYFDRRRRYRTTAPVLGVSRSLNQSHGLQAPPKFVSSGSNREDFQKVRNLYSPPFDEALAVQAIPLELHKPLLQMFSDASKDMGHNAIALRELFDTELSRPEFQLPDIPKVESLQSLKKPAIKAKNTGETKGVMSRIRSFF